MKNISQKLILVLAISMSMMSCHDDLDQSPIDPDSFTEENVFANATEAKSALAKLYASFALTGQNGPTGQPDIAGIDEGFSQFSRMLFNLNELTTDHSVVGWGDAGLPDLHGGFWSSSNDFTEAMYSRLAQAVSFCNSFISNASAVSDPEIQTYIAEARFIRAYTYYNLIDMYANVPLLTEVSTELPTQSSRAEIFSFIESELLEIENLLVAGGSNEYGRVDEVAAWALLSRLYLNAEVFIGQARYNDAVTYSNNVLNSSYSLHTNDANNNGSSYDDLFLADNDSNGSSNEFIYALNFDGLQSQTFGGTTFLVHASIGGTMDPGEFGVNGGWGGLRATKALVDKFNIDTNALNTNLGAQSDWGLVGSATENGWDGPDQEMYEIGTDQYAIYVKLVAGEMKFRFNEDDNLNYGDESIDSDNMPAGPDGILDTLAGNNILISADGTYYITMDLNTLEYKIRLADARAMFHTDGQSLDIENVPPFNNGYAVTKFKNVDSDGESGVDTAGDFVDTDLPLMRLPEFIFNYAEATLRGGAGNISIAVAEINKIRERAYGNTNGNITSSDLTLEFILDERSRELYWEGQRRTDLVRYNLFTTSNYVWPFKGNSTNGSSIDTYRDIFPLPINILSTNPNLSQNTGY